MKYLVSTSDGPALFPGQKTLDVLEAIVLPGFKVLQELERKGTIVGGVPLGGRSFVFIIEAESNSEVDEILHALSMWGVLEWEVTALQSFQGRADFEKEAVARLKTGK